jgi:pimeloyl-ACP methyl ester carboxylesterase
MSTSAQEERNSIMGHVISKDGTPIAYQRAGDGPPLILVHGTGGAATRWTPLLSVLGQHFTVYAIDRRGRRESGDTEPYAAEREFEDIAAVAESTGGPAYVLGHSYGGFCALGCALGAALISAAICKLILYEPPIPLPGVEIFPDGLVERYEGMLAAGDREGVLTAFLREVVRTPPDELDKMRALPAWEARLAAAHTLPRELRMHVDYRFDMSQVAQLNIPVLLMIGGNSPGFFRAAIDALDRALPDSRVVVLPGQGHSAMDTAPELFVREVEAFLSE